MADSITGSIILYELIEEIVTLYLRNIILVTTVVTSRSHNRLKVANNIAPSYSMIARMPSQMIHLERLIGLSNADCMSNLRVDRNTFGRLCLLLRDVGGVKDNKYVTVDEQVALFLGVLAHHKKNRVVGFDFCRSGETISKYVNIVLKAVLKLHGLLLVKPEPVTEDCSDSRWKWFQGCLGALDGTYIDVQVPNSDKPRFRTRKGHISTNTLAVCDRNLKFVYVLPGWEGSAGDARILRDAVNRVHGLKVPKGNYYLCDNGYANSEGFLTPYKGVRYHLKEWGPNTQTPQNPHEIYNMRHTKARNVIERAFGIMKMRWGILRSASYYPVKTQVRLIMACFLLHNFIRNEMADDPMEVVIEEMGEDLHDEVVDGEAEYVDGIEATPEWNNKRDVLANDMWADYA